MTRRDGVGGFRSPEARARFLSVYDTLVEQTWPVPCEELDVATSYGSTHVRRSGPAAGAPLVLLHPGIVSSVIWSRLVEPLAEHHPVYALDTMGTAGRSVQVAPLGGWSGVGRWFEETVAGLGLEGVHVVGWSEGGWVALLAGMSAPARIGSLTLLEPAAGLRPFRPADGLRGIVAGLPLLTGLGSPHTALVKLSRWVNPETELTELEVQLMLTAIKAHRYRLPFPKVLSDKQLASISMPTLVLLAEKTVINHPREVADRANALLPDVEVEIVPGAGHDLPVARPERVAARILQFVDNPSRTMSGSNEC